MTLKGTNTSSCQKKWILNPHLLLPLSSSEPNHSRLRVGVDFCFRVKPRYSFRSAFCCTCGLPELAFLTIDQDFSRRMPSLMGFLSKVSEVKSSVMALSFSAILCAFWLLYVTMLPQFKFVLLWEDVWNLLRPFDPKDNKLINLSNAVNSTNVFE